MGRAIPKSDRKLLIWLANLNAKASTVLNPLGFAAADYGAIAGDYAALQAVLTDQAAKAAASQSATETKKATRAAVDDRLQVLVRRVKGHPLYTPAIGEQLGIVAPQAAAPAGRGSAAAMDLRPRLRGVVGGEGSVTLKFAKQGYTGVALYCRRAGETEFTLLTKQFRSPLVDHRPNLVAGMPEMREYMAQFLRGDTPVGQMSDVLVLTVPVTATLPATATATATAAVATVARREAA